MSHEKSLYAVLDQVRLAASAMRRISEATHADRRVTAAMRAVLERLSRAGPQTVPTLARARAVSRQHVQKVVDGLVRSGFVELRANPAHRRSPLVSLTREGGDAFAAIAAREAAIVADLATRLADRNLGATARALRALNEALGAIASETRG